MVAKYGMLEEKSRLRTSWPMLMQMGSAAEKIQNCLTKNMWTDDVPVIEHYRGHLVFVYGSLKNGFPRGNLITKSRAKFVAIGITSNKYSLFYAHKKKEDRFPVLLPTINNSPVANVVGQVWIVPPAFVYELDKIESNGSLYRRIKLNIQLISKPLDLTYQKYACIYCWTYLGIMDSWAPSIMNGDLAHIEPKPFFDTNDTTQYLNYSHSLALGMV